MMVSACSGDMRSRRRRLGKGRMGRSGYMGDAVSGDERSGEERFHSYPTKRRGSVRYAVMDDSMPVQLMVGEWRSHGEKSKKSLGP